MASQKSDIAVINERIEWHSRVGWVIAGIYAVIFGGFVTWYLPKELQQQKKEIVDEIHLDIDKITKLQLDKVSAQIITARNSHLKIDPKVVRNLGADVLNLLNSKNPEVSQQAWRTVNEVVGYYSFVNSSDPSISRFVDLMEKHAFRIKGESRAADCMGLFRKVKGLILEGAIVENCTMHLDKWAEEAMQFHNVLFRDATIVYEGGRLAIDNVAFINCKFQISPGDPSEKLTRAVLMASQPQQLDLP